MKNFQQATAENLNNLEDSENLKENTDVTEYKTLNNKCDIVISKIKNRKQNKK